MVAAALIIINALASIFFDTPMFYDYFPDIKAWWYMNQSDGEYYLKVVPAEPEYTDFRYLWLLVGLILIIFSYLRIKKEK